MEGQDDDPITNAKRLENDFLRKVSLTLFRKYRPEVEKTIEVADKIFIRKLRKQKSLIDKLFNDLSLEDQEFFDFLLETDQELFEAKERLRFLKARGLDGSVRSKQLRRRIRDLIDLHKTLWECSKLSPEISMLIEVSKVEYHNPLEQQFEYN